ncbi:Conserved_hypothetical protein [Hexamita inflata]|uniref:Uncharacterized protein n=1 Tax=Hexamita inflata TaxID=28002 RepID=A0AA86R6V3_9EUKA|nr:Conserved hypothetical protein [Hexamita inflata]
MTSFLLSSIVIYSILTNQNASSCNNNILLNSKQYSYCQKGGLVNQMKVNNIALQTSNKIQHIFLITGKMQSSQIVSEVTDANNFAVFGFNAETQQILSCTINVTLTFNTFNSALLCLQCDVSLENSLMVFIASGQVLSGMLINSISAIVISNSSLQHRFSSQLSAGLVVNASQMMTTFELTNVVMLGYNEQTAGTSLLVLHANANITISISDVKVCSNTTQKNTFLTLSSPIVSSCQNMCAASAVFVYGICADTLINGLLQNFVYACVDPFRFNGSQCVCKEHYILNGSKCFDLTQKLTETAQTLQIQNDSLTAVQTEIGQVYQAMQQLSSGLQNNLNQTNLLVHSLFNQSEYHILENVSNINAALTKASHVLDQSIYNNASMLYTAIDGNHTQLQNEITQKVQELNASIIDLLNSSAVISSLNHSIQTVNQSLLRDISVLQQDVQNKYQSLSQYVLGNVSELNSNLQGNFSALEQRIVANATSLYSAIASNASLLSQSILSINSSLLGNISVLQQDIYSKTQTQEQYLQGNISTIRSQASNNFTTLDKQIAANTSNLYLAVSTNISALNLSVQQSIQNSTSSLYLALAANISVKDQQIKSLNDSLAFISSIVLNTKEQELWFQCQQQLYTFKTFDMTSATHDIQDSNFSSGFAFGASQNIQNAFVDVQSFGAGFTLFQTQTAFSNIKIQLNDLTFSSGSLLSQSTTIVINQLGVVSKAGTSITVSSGTGLSLLQLQAVQSNITNLLLNITMSLVSTGSLNLVGAIKGNLYVKGYKILGTYFSTNVLALGSQTAQDSTVFFNYVFIAPTQYTVGNLSSYLLALVNNSNVQINHVSIQVGNVSIYNQISLISTTQANFMQFGGLIACGNTSNIYIIDLQFISYEQLTQQFVSYSGQILGYIINTSTNLLIVCVGEQINAQINTEIYMFGLLGYINGNLQVNILDAEYYIQQGVYNVVGIIGLVNGSSMNALNVIIQIQTSKNQTGQYFGGFSCFLQATQQSISNITINNSIITATTLIGLVAAACQKLTIQNAYISSSYIYCKSNDAITTVPEPASAYSGGMIAETWNQLTIYISIIQNITMYSYAASQWAISGGIVGDSHANTVSISQTNVKESIIQAFGSLVKSVSASALDGFLYNATILIQNAYVDNIKFSVSSNAVPVSCSGFMSSMSNVSVTINNSQVTSIVMLAYAPYVSTGIIQSNNGASTFIVSDVQTNGVNIINNVIIQNCASVVSQSQSGC